MAVNLVKGQILSSILERDGIDISIANANVGIGTVSPTGRLEVVGNVKVGNVIISNIGNISAGNVNINNLAAPVANADATTKFYVDQAVGNSSGAVLGNLTISNTTISANIANATITIQPTGTGLVTIDTTTGLVIPTGNTAQRPSPEVTGTVRFNTTTSRVEVYDGTEWDQVGQGAVTNQTLNGDGSTITFVLDRTTTTAAALVILNGITQVPTQAYAMSPSPGNSLVFTEAPATGDVIDIRFL
jgi:hypothetical protein